METCKTLQDNLDKKSKTFKDVCEFLKSIIFNMTIKNLLLAAIALLPFQITSAQKTALPEVMDVTKIRFDGKFQRLFTIKEFEANFQKPDSTALLIDLQPCSYYFEYEDGSKDADDEYWYKDGSRFERSKDRLVVDEFRFSDGHFIQYGDFKINSSTTVKDLTQHFPNAVAAMDELEVHHEGKLRVIFLREDAENISDGQIRLYLKDGKPYALHWWFPC